MLYRITIDIAFADEDAVDDILDKTFDHWPDAQPINPRQANMEPAFIRIQRCYHDQTPTQPCITTHYVQKPPVP